MKIYYILYWIIFGIFGLSMIPTLQIIAGVMMFIALCHQGNLNKAHFEKLDKIKKG